MTKEEKKIHDLKFELRQQRERIDKLEQENIEHKKCHAALNATIMMQFQLINALCDLSKGMAEDIAKMNVMMAKEEKK